MLLAYTRMTMNRHLEVIENFEHTSPAPHIGSAETAEEVRAITLPVIELLKNMRSIENGVCYAQVQFHLGAPRHAVKILNDWATRIVHLATDEATETVLPYSVVLQAVVDEEAINDHLATQASDLYSAFHTDPYDFYDPISKTTFFLKGSKPRRLMVINGVGTNAVQGLIQADHATRFEPWHSDENPYSNCFEDFSDLLVGAESQFLRGAVSEIGQRIPLEGSFTVQELPTKTWVDIPPETVHSVPKKVTNGRFVVFVNPQEHVTFGTGSDIPFTVPK